MSNIAQYILKEKIRQELRRLFEEEDLFANSDENDTEKDQPDNSKTTEKEDDEEYTLDGIIQKLNTIRSGRSFKDKDIIKQMEAYYNDLQDPEKKALNAFLLGISQIITAGVQGSTAPEPSEPPTNVKMIDKQKIHKKEIKPNIIKKGGLSTPNSKSLEDTSSPVTVKKKG